ncbi:MAG: amidohydrolase family protein [Planctomycetota bacterium]|nr:amidohydrolase family protein [Planctomycetota bacterium]
MKKVRISAEILFDGEGHIRRNVRLTLFGGRVVSIEEKIDRRREDAEIRLDSALVLPGFVNAHTHLELSRHQAEVKDADFIEWLYQMRLKLDAATKEELTKAALKGIEESLSSGTSALVEHTNAEASLSPLLEAPLRSVIAFEAVGYNQTDVKKERILAHLRGVKKNDMHRLAIAPHSLYRASEDLLRFCADVASKNSLLISCHISETKEEVEFFKYGTGRFRSLLERFGAIPYLPNPSGKSPLLLLDDLNLLTERTLLVHCNYPEGNDFALIKKRGATVVYCPRSHSFFRHSPHPLELFLEQDIPVIFGTDSLASTPSLSILDELKFVKRERPALPAEKLLSLATRTAARLILGEEFGVIREGAPADLCAIKLPHHPASDNSPLELALHPESEVNLTVVGGKVVFQK